MSAVEPTQQHDSLRNTSRFCPVAWSYPSGTLRRRRAAWPCLAFEPSGRLGDLWRNHRVGREDEVGGSVLPHAILLLAVGFLAV